MFYMQIDAFFATELVIVLATAWWCYRQKKRPRNDDDGEIKMLIKGPKAVLSAAIATALDEVFVVDAQSIKSNLFRDAKIVLRDLELRPQHRPLPNAVATVTGSVDQVVFSWAWGMSKDGGWIKDVTLSIEGLKMNAQLVSQDKTQETSPAILEAIEEATAEYVEEKEVNTKGGIHAYIQKQVLMIIDSLKLNVDDIEVTIQLPKEEHHKGMYVIFGTQAFELVSSGRLLFEEEEASEELPGILKQPASLASFYSNVQIGDTIFPFIDPFSYSVETTRSGERFASWTTNLSVVGHSKNDFVVHAGYGQICALTRLSVLLMATPEPSTNETKPSPEAEVPRPNTVVSQNGKTKISSQAEAPRPDSVVIQNGIPSNFAFELSLMSIFLEKATVTVPNVSFHYQADGTVMSFKAQGFQFHHDDASISVTGIHASMASPVALYLESIDELYVSQWIKATKPITNVKIIEEGKNLSIFVESIEATLLGTVDKNTGGAEVSTDDQRVEESSISSGVSIPFPMSISLDNVQLRNSTDGSLMQLRDFRLYVNPYQSATQVAIELGEFQNDLLLLNKMHFCGTFPANKGDEIDAFHCAAESGRVAAGHSVNDWYAAFKPALPQSTFRTSVWKLPYAKVDQLKLVISYKVSILMKFKDTKITIKPFEGNADSTSEDVLHYYAQACLSRAPTFIPNANVLGLNVVDTSASTWGAMVVEEGMGPVGGVVAIAAVDGVKNAISAGKKRRHADEGDRMRPFDFFRGIVHTIEKANKDGAAIRGKCFGTSGGEDPFVDIPLGIVMDTGRYAYKNRKRLAVGAAGGVGFFFGAEVGGPAGAIFIGLAAQYITAKAIDKAEEMHKDKKSKFFKIEAVEKVENLLEDEQSLDPP